MRTVFISFLMAAASSAAIAQQSMLPKGRVDVAITYEANRSNLVPGASFWLQGGAVQLDAEIIKGFGIAADFSGLHSSKISSSGVALDMVTETFGPHYRWSVPSHSKKADFSLYGHALIGEADAFHSVFPGANGSDTSASAFALKAGGGMDLALNYHLAIRLVQAEWLYTQFPNAALNTQNSFQVGSGLVMRFH
jgi:hypothetical protein